MIQVTDETIKWPETKPVALFLTDGGGYKEAFVKIAESLIADHDGGVIITANRPTATLRPSLDADLSQVTFVDCISSMTGIMPPMERGVIHIESPTMLEKMALRAERALRAVPGDRRFLLLDSLSTLAVYNGPAAVRELTHNLVTRLRMLGVTGAFVLVQNQTDAMLVDAVRPLCDETVNL